MLENLNPSTPGFPLPKSDDKTRRAQKHKHSKPANRFIKTRLKGREALGHAAYFLTVAAVGIPICIKILVTEPLPEMKTTILLSVLGLVSYHLAVVLPSNVQVHPGFPLLISALFCHGISAAILVIVPSFLLHFYTKKHGLCNCLFNAGQFTLSVYAAESAGLWAGWKQGTPATNLDLVPIVFMILAYDTVNVLLVCVSRAIENNEAVLESFVKLFYIERRAVLAQRTFLAVVAMLLSSHMGNIAFIVVFIGVLSLRLQNRFQKELVIKTEEARTDPLTQVHNLRFLETWVETEFKSLVESKSRCSFIFLDVDGLKAVNDSYGHNVGDSLLIHVAKIITANTRSRDRVTRYGGDEFIVLCPDTNLAQAESIARHILEAANKTPFIHSDAKIEFGISIGVASWPEHGETSTDIIRMADKAMYLAKRSGGNTVHTAASL